MNKTFFIAFTFLLIHFFATAQKSPEPFQKGDRVIFVGNSITEAGFYESYVWLYYITHFPDRKLEVMNGGIGGDVAGQIYTRLEGDVLAKKPNVMIVTFGMNDSRYFEYGWHKDAVDSLRKAAVDTSYNSYKLIEQKLTALPGITKILMTSSPYDETVKNEKNYFPGKWKTMDRIAAFQKEGAAKNNWAFVDLFHPMTTLEGARQKDDSTYTLTGPARIHPGNAGHFVMAYLFLKAQGLDNKPVAGISIDGAKNKVVQTTNCTVSALSAKDGALSFSYLAKSLPFPTDTVARIWENPQKQSDALSVVPFTKEFNEEMLTVKGLKGKSYRILIDSNEVATASAQQLSEGMNLALLTNTPQYKQAKAIMEVQLQHKQLEDKIRAYYWVNYDYLYAKGMLFNDSQASLDSVLNEAKKNWFVASKKDAYTEVRSQSVRDDIQKQMDALRDQMYTMAKPTPHTVRIEAVSEPK